jgi:3-oxoacyl-[acyl-carrier protein] reductase
MDLSLHGKRALVCGASQGIGAACAKVLAAQGCQVIALARNASLLDQLLASLAGSGHSKLVVDLTEHSALQRHIELQLQAGHIHILVNNSGGPAPGTAIDTPLASLQAAFDQHVKANVLLTQLLLPGMQTEQFGRIINIISTSVKSPIPNLAASNTARWAMASWAKTLSREVASDGITVNNILPGATDTARLQGLLQTLANNAGHDIATEARAWQAQIPCGRFGKPEEIANAVAFLASHAAAYINGVALAIDGGRTASL